MSWSLMWHWWCGTQASGHEITSLTVKQTMVSAHFARRIVWKQCNISWMKQSKLLQPGSHCDRNGNFPRTPMQKCNHNDHQCHMPCMGLTFHPNIHLRHDCALFWNKPCEHFPHILIEWKITCHNWKQMSQGKAQNCTVLASVTNLSVETQPKWALLKHFHLQKRPSDKRLQTPHRVEVSVAL